MCSELKYPKTSIFLTTFGIGGIPFGEGMQSYDSRKALGRKYMSSYKMLEGRPAIHPGIYKLLDHVTQGKKKK